MSSTRWAALILALVSSAILHDLAFAADNGIPVIKVEDADFGRKRTLYLKHYHDGRDLLLEYAEHTLKHVQNLWGHEVVLETILSAKPTLLKLVGDTLKAEKVS